MLLLSQLLGMLEQLITFHLSFGYCFLTNVRHVVLYMKCALTWNRHNCHSLITVWMICFSFDIHDVVTYLIIMAVAVGSGCSMYIASPYTGSVLSFVASCILSVNSSIYMETLPCIKKRKIQLLGCP